MKIALVTNNQTTVSQHFGKAKQYIVYTIEDGKIVSIETRDKPVFHKPDSVSSERHEHGLGHGHGDGKKRHKEMTDVILDCQAIIAGGMGNGAYQNFLSIHIQPILTDTKLIEETVEAYIRGTLQNKIELLH